MFWRGLWLTLLLWILLVAVGTVLARMWPGFGTA
jgi:hypothetical protein